MKKIQENNDNNNQEKQDKSDRQKQALKESQQYFRQHNQGKKEEAEAFQVGLEKRGLIEKGLSLNTDFAESKNKQGDIKLTMFPESERSGKFKVTAIRKGVILAMDSFKPSEAKRRLEFANTIKGLDNEEKELVIEKLTELADRVLNGSKVTQPEKTKKQVNFAVLSDGRIIEQTTKGFAVFTPDSKTFEFSPLVEDNDCLYEPQSFQTDNRGETLIGLPSDIVEYGDDSVLDAEIENYLYRHIDLPERERKFVVQYIKLTYLTDKLEEIPYLRAVGEKGNGKSRFILAVGLLCYHPLFVISITAAVLFRVVDTYHPTLIIDEANLNVESDDTQAIMQILNGGNQRLGNVPRMEVGGAFGERHFEIFDPFGAKILASLKTFDSAAFESRCIRVLMQKTTRTEIRYRLTKALKSEAEVLRNKLTLWRFRNYNRDFEHEFNAAEEALKAEYIEPRYVQIGTPLYAMIRDENLRRDFAVMLKQRSNADTEERRDSLDGHLVQAMHDLLVESKTDESGSEVPKLKGEFKEGEPCALLTVEAITNKLNKDKPEKDHLKKEFVSKTLSKLELERRKINARQEHRGKSAVLFNKQRLAQLFMNYDLPVPIELLVQCKSDISGETAVASVANDNKPIKTDSLDWRQSKDKENTNNNKASQDNSNQIMELNGMARAATANSDKTAGNTLFSSKDDPNELANDEDDSPLMPLTFQCPNCNANCSIEDSHCPNCEQNLSSN